ncbi:TetR/AcrR family transcriptional regulator [Limibacter armeniacum]|uniref:TetR/AcrR family transcriptional regulator n=1 Tax=Limibacter armeniacum TaxID=466084 RepID=UPI002FE69C44
MVKKQSKQALLQATVDLISEKGYFGTGLNEVLSLSNAPKGSLYYYFPNGKNQLMVEAITLAGEQVSEVLRQTFIPENDLKTAFEQVFHFFVQQLEASNFKKSCPVATVASESAALDEEVRVACKQVYTAWNQLIKAFLLQKGIPEETAQKQAQFALNLIEGNLLMSRVFQNTEHLKLGLVTLLETIK